MRKGLGVDYHQHSMQYDTDINFIFGIMLREERAVAWFLAGRLAPSAARQASSADGGPWRETVAWTYL